MERSFVEWLAHNAIDGVGYYVWLYEDGVLWVAPEDALLEFRAQRRRLGLPIRGLRSWRSVKARLQKTPYWRGQQLWYLRDATRFLYGFDLATAHDAGLDVPATLGQTRIEHRKEGG